jgi:4-hydroxy-4-methyl-2-oxoglutarate aldolase
MAETPPVLTVNRSFNRCDSSAYQTLVDLPIGNVVDAQGRVGAIDYRIKPITSRYRFAGSALTIDAGPRDNLAAWVALEYARPGDVLLIATGGYELSSVVGDLFVGMAKNAGVAAVITDGVVRDLDGLEAVGIPVFARGISSNSPQKNGPGTIGLPIVIGGVSAASGDVVCGDRDGVVIVSRQRLASVKHALVGVIKKEQAMDAAVQSGTTVPDWVGQVKKTMRIDYLD